MGDLYTEEDPEYRNTELVSPHPAPTRQLFDAIGRKNGFIPRTPPSNYQRSSSHSRRGRSRERHRHDNDRRHLSGGHGRYGQRDTWIPPPDRPHHSNDHHRDHSHQRHLPPPPHHHSHGHSHKHQPHIHYHPYSDANHDSRRRDHSRTDRSADFSQPQHLHPPAPLNHRRLSPRLEHHRSPPPPSSSHSFGPSHGQHPDNAPGYLERPTSHDVSASLHRRPLERDRDLQRSQRSPFQPPPHLAPLPSLQLPADNHASFPQPPPPQVTSDGAPPPPPPDTVIFPSDNWMEVTVYKYRSDRMRVHWLHRAQVLSTAGAMVTVVDCKNGVDSETFGDVELVQSISELKRNLFRSSKEDLKRARAIANPFACLAAISGFPSKRVVVMANLDAELQFTKLCKNKTLHFADLCCSYGGYSEYISWRRNKEGLGPCRGWGISLANGQLPDPKHFHECKNDSFFRLHPGKDKSGDITRMENLLALSESVMKETKREGVSLVIAGGRSDWRCSNGGDEMLEIHYKRLFLCEILGALMMLRKGGMFLCKIFDAQSSFTVGMLFILYQAFEEMAIVKPDASGIDTAERFVVCRNFQGDIPLVLMEHLVRINALFDTMQAAPFAQSGPPDITQIIANSYLNGTKSSWSKFYSFIHNANIRMDVRKREALLAVRYFLEHPMQREPIELLQRQIRDFKYKEWQLVTTEFGS